MSAKKRKKKQNPLLKARYDEGFNKGFEAGKKQGVQQAVSFFRFKFEGLEDVKGIGQVTMNKIKEQLGKKYF